MHSPLNCSIIAAVLLLLLVLSPTGHVVMARPAAATTTRAAEITQDAAALTATSTIAPVTAAAAAVAAVTETTNTPAIGHRIDDESAVAQRHTRADGNGGSGGGDDDLAHQASNLQASGISITGSTAHFIGQEEQPAVPISTYPLETEGIPSRILTVYEQSQSAVGKFLNPLPIVDTIQEHEKYGNSGDKFYPIGRAIVSTYEGFSNLLNRLLDAPLELAKKASRGLTGTLNSVGGKIVGL